MTAEEKVLMIDLLVVMTGKQEAYYTGMSDERLLQEYDRMMETPNG